MFGFTSHGFGGLRVQVMFWLFVFYPSVVARGFSPFVVGSQDPTRNPKRFILQLSKSGLVMPVA